MTHNTRIAALILLLAAALTAGASYFAANAGPLRLPQLEKCVPYPIPPGYPITEPPDCYGFTPDLACNVVIGTCESVAECGNGSYFKAAIDSSPVWANHRICEVFLVASDESTYRWFTNGTFDEGYQASGIGARTAYVWRTKPGAPAMAFIEVKAGRYEVLSLPVILREWLPWELQETYP